MTEAAMADCVVGLGRCVGCAAFGRLAGPFRDACSECLSGLRRGPRWLALARRVRTDPAFAAAAYAALPESWRDHFHRVFGRPAAVGHLRDQAAVGSNE
jgi:hypothetical protein